MNPPLDIEEHELSPREYDPEERIAVPRGSWDEAHDALARLRAAADALVRRLRAVHEADEYRAVWTLAALHGHRYAGPTYTDELAALEAALAPDAP